MYNAQNVQNVWDIKILLSTNKNNCQFVVRLLFHWKISFTVLENLIKKLLSAWVWTRGKIKAKHSVRSEGRNVGAERRTSVTGASTSGFNPDTSFPGPCFRGFVDYVRRYVPVHYAQESKKQSREAESLLFDGRRRKRKLPIIRQTRPSIHGLPRIPSCA